MIFISHSHRDKSFVEPIALRLAKVYGEENVFYDTWSIQPGESIIEKIKNGLSTVIFFFFFVSRNSLISKMAEMEWQKAIFLQTKGKVKFIAVKLDDCIMPPVLFQNLYIDYNGKGPEIAIRQMIDVINGKNVYRRGEVPEFQNIRGYVYPIHGGYKIEFRAEAYLEPQSIFLILLPNAEEDFQCTVKGLANPTRFQKGAHVEGGSSYNALIVSRSNATSLGFPFIIELTQKRDKPITILDLLHAKSDTEAKSIPFTYGD